MPGASWQGFLLIAIVIATLFGNILCLYILVRLQRRLLKRPLYIFIFNICVADIAVVLCSMIFKITDFFYQDWLYGEGMCQFVEYSQRALFRVNVLTHTSIAFERYFSVVFALKPQVQISKPLARRILAAIWVLSFLLSIPLIFSFEVLKGGDERICRLVHLPWLWLDKLYNSFDLAVFFIIPLAVTLFLYGSIITSLNRRKRRTGDLGSISATMNTIRAAIRGVRVSIIVLTAFLICWIPVIVKGFNRLVHRNANRDRKDELYIVAMYLAFVNDAIVPILYCLLDSNLAPSVWTIFYCFNRDGQSEETSDGNETINE
ncbi:QRFP-like peptide receptor [Dendronephthya gigantea]|uniref:QRFP-like peptide receptor n=1 Tax=Dendronephthya gigantea TaxID=151771 RepID=UPI00106BFB21|nr:QRFP-like peptide receptor [Dendronephthya gigantea]